MKFSSEAITPILRDLAPWTLFAAVFAISLVLALILKKWLWLQIEHWARRVPNNWRTYIVRELNLPARMAIIGLTVSFAQNFVPSSFQHQTAVDVGLEIYFIVVTIMILDRIAKVVIRSDNGYFSNLNGASRQLIFIIARVVVFTIGGLFVLDSLGISITPLLASLGVGSVAVALALQDTLSNFFSGIYVLADRPVNIGDYVRVDDVGGVEGYVCQIGWRSTRIQLLSGTVVVVPNSKLASSRLTNFNMPTSETIFTVDFAIARDSNLEAVEKGANETVQTVANSHKDILASDPPTVRFTGFTGDSITLTIAMKAKRFVDSFPIRHELIKCLQARFKAEGIKPWA